MTDDLGRGQYQVEVDADTSGVRAVEGAIEKAGDAAEGAAGKATGAFGRFGDVGKGAIMGVGLAVGNLATTAVMQAPLMLIGKLGDSIGLASDKAEAASKVNVLFGESADKITAASEGAAEAVGLTSSAYLAAAGNLGNLLTNFDITGEAAADMSNDLIGLASDMGSFNNASTEEVTEAMGAAFRGEAEPIRRFGVMLSDVTVKAKAVELGLYSGTGALSANARAQATYALILEQTSAAQGDFARTADGLANSSRISAAKQEEAWTRLGEKLAPLAAKVMPMLADAGVAIIDMIAGLLDSVMEWIADNQELVDTLGDIVGLIGGALAAAFGLFMGYVGELARRMSGFIGVVIDVLGAIVDLGGVIVKVFSGDFEGAAASAESAMDRIGSAGENMRRAIGDESQRAADEHRDAMAQMGTHAGKAMDDLVATTETGMDATVAATEAGMAEVVEVAAWGGEKTPGAFAEGSRKSFDDVRTAFTDLRQLMKDTLDPAKEEAELVGIATSRRLAKGLNDERPAVRYEAQQIALDTIEQLVKLNPKSEQIGQLSMKLLASASEAEKSTVRKAIAQVTGVAEDELEALPGVGRDAGERTVTAFGAGMTAKQEQAIRSARLFVTKIRDIMELGSPAREGPWSERGGPEAWMDRAAAKMTGAFSGRIRAGITDVRGALGDLASAAAIATPAGLGVGLGAGGPTLTIVHRIEDPDGSLGDIATTPAEVARELAGGLDASGFLANVRHAAATE